MPRFCMIEFRQLPDDHPDLASSPLLRAALLTLRYAQEHNGIGLTPNKAFKRVFVHWAAEHFDCVIQLGSLRIMVAYSSRVKSGRRSLFSPLFTNRGTFLCARNPRATASSNTRFIAELCVFSVLALGSRPILTRRHS